MRNPLLRAALTVTDLLLAAFTPGRRAPRPAPRRVLLALGGHLGDAVMLTAVLRRLRAISPDVEIGVVLPSWSRVVIERDPTVSWVHAVDHWKGNRSRASVWAKWRQYRASRRAAIRDIQAVGYDAAVDLRPHFPNMAAVLWQAKVPVRVGFTSGGFGALYTDRLEWRDDHTHVVTRQIELLEALYGKQVGARPLRYELPPADERVEAEVSALLAQARIGAEEYVVVHMGSGSEERHWSREEWHAVAMALATEGRRLAFTGQGAREEAMVRAVSAGVAGAVDLCDRLHWNAFVEVIRRASLVLTVETAAAHVAAATRTPAVLVWRDVSSARHWRPLGDRVTLVTPATSETTDACCAACADVTWVRGLSAAAVVAAARRLVAAPAPATARTSREPASR